MKGLWDQFNAESKSSTCEKYVKVPDFFAEEGSEGSDTLAKDMDCDMDAFLGELALWCGDEDHSALDICTMVPEDIVAMCTADPELCKHKHEEFCMAHPDGPGCERWITCPDMKVEEKFERNFVF